MIIHDEMDIVNSLMGCLAIMVIAPYVIFLIFLWKIAHEDDNEDSSKEE